MAARDQQRSYLEKLNAAYLRSRENKSNQMAESLRGFEVEIRGVITADDAWIIERKDQLVKVREQLGIERIASEGIDSTEWIEHQDEKAIKLLGRLSFEETARIKEARPVIERAPAIGYASISEEFEIKLFEKDFQENLHDVDELRD